MCGIAGFYLKRPLKGIKLDQLTDTLIHAIDHRGGDATGLAAFGADGLLAFEKASCDGYKFTRGRNLLPMSGVRIVMVHTRLETQGESAFPKNNHPVVNGDVFVTHNGHISNDIDMWHKIGWERRTADVDSEVIPGLVSMLGWESYAAALEEFQGSMAIAMVNSNHPDELVLAKGEWSPLVIVENRDIVMWASTHDAIKRAWAAAIGTPPKGARFLKEGEIVHIKDGVSTDRKFRVKWNDRWQYYNTGGGTTTKSGDSCITVVTSGGTKTHRVTDAKNKRPLRPKGGFKNQVNVYDLQAWGWSDQEIKEYIDDLKADHDDLRLQADAILQRDPGWWEDQQVLIEFNNLWDRIREIKDEIEELAWAEIDREWERDEDDASGEADEGLTLIQCPSCLEAFPLEDMTGGDDLYCSDCWGFWLDSTMGRDIPAKDGGLLDVNGDPIPGY